MKQIVNIFGLMKPEAHGDVWDALQTGTTYFTVVGSLVAVRWNMPFDDSLISSLNRIKDEVTKT